MLQIGNEVFSSQRAALAHIRAVLARHELGKGIWGDDGAFLNALLDRHPDARLKRGVGVSRFYKMLNAAGHPELWLERIDGTATDWSYRSCIESRSHARAVKRAFRAAVRSQVAKARKRFNRRADAQKICPVTGENLANVPSHVDHEVPFETLLCAFLDAQKLQLDEILLTETADKQLGREIADLEIRAAWQRFHREKASLRVVSIKANLSILRRSVA